nr:ribosomal protein L20 [Adromischus cristatus]YP_011026371.1 ribosomal protein L20 [Dudleya farinosa]WQM99940.1 ribosomal protein L20 [Adromischus cristatus]WQN00365.1 ribosomal protein L20 [Dudleya farinosa]
MRLFASSFGGLIQDLLELLLNRKYEL